MSREPYDPADAVIERLDVVIERLEAIESLIAHSISEGERRAIERVRKVVGNPDPKVRAASMIVECTLAERKRIYDELGLGEEEKP